LRGLDETSRPDVIALVFGGLAEVKGDDADGETRRLDHELSTRVLSVHAPDFAGGLEDGYLSAVQALLVLAEEPRSSLLPTRSRVTMLAGPSLTPADARELREIVESFGLQPTLLPDLGALDGSREGLSALAIGGVSAAEIAEIGLTGHTIVIGASLEPAARALYERFGTTYTVFDAATGLAETDDLLAQLTLLSGQAVPERLERDRAVLVDAMRDAHLRIAGKRIALALEPDHAAAIGTVLDEMAARPVCAVVPTAAPVVHRIPAEEAVVGDFASVPAYIDLLVSGSHGRRTAEMLGVPLFETGFPRFEVFGASRQLTVGYRGATAIVDAIANLLAPAHEHVLGRTATDTTSPERSTR
jgi:nitrogenase molybdenum-iron protein NifN